MRVLTSFGCGRSGPRYQKTFHTSSGGASSSNENSCRCTDLNDIRLPRGQLLHRRRETVLPAPVVVVVHVRLGHHVVLPPECVQAAGENRDDDPLDVLVLLLEAGGVGWRYRGAETCVDGRQLVLDRTFGPIVRDEVSVEEDVQDDLHDADADERDERPRDRVAEL